MTMDAKERELLAAEGEILQERGEKTKTQYKTLYRGMVLNQETVAALFSVGSKYEFDTLSATSTDKKLASIYADAENLGIEDGLSVILEIQKPDGIYGVDRGGAEIVVPKGSVFRVERVVKDDNGVIHVSLYSKKGKNVTQQERIPTLSNSVKKLANIQKAMDDWFEYENAQFMREAVKHRTIPYIGKDGSVLVDEAAGSTDKTLQNLEKRIREIYAEAERDIQAKTKDFWERHKAKDAIYRQQVQNGKITMEDYQAWMRGQVFQGEQWDAKLYQIQHTLTQANKAAVGIVNGDRIGVFATNANWQAYQIEKTAGVNFGFGIYDADAVTRLLRDDPSLLPPKKLNATKDGAWNKGVINRQISQGIIQGESLDKIAKRLRNAVTGINLNQSLTYARTAMTGAQNAGRQESYQRAINMGINLKREWMATLDSHTRHTHAALDGQVRGVDEPFTTGGYSIMYPGDPHATPAMVYNCRCTLIAKLVDYPQSEYMQRRDNITGKPINRLTYQEWVGMKTSPPITPVTPIVPVAPKVAPPPKPQPSMPGLRKSLGDQYVDEMDRILDRSPEPRIKELYHKFGDRLKVTDPNSKEGAYFNTGDEGVHMNAEMVAKGDVAHVPYQTAFHEFGHNIDYLAGEGTPVSTTYKDGALNATIQSDFEEFTRKFISDNPRTFLRTKQDARRYLSRISKEDPTFDSVVKSFNFDEISIEDIFKEHGDRIAGYILHDPDSSPEWIHNKIIRRLKLESMPLTQCGSLSDMLEFCTRVPFPLRVGHGVEYWASGDMDERFGTSTNTNGPAEFFAEVCDGMASNPESLAQIRRVFPNAVVMVEEIIEEVLRE